jgi:hypothetical protein
MLTNERTPLKRLHPALDFTTENVYIGQKMRMLRKERYYIISDQGDLIPTTPEDILDRYHIVLSHPPYRYSEIRWSTENIKRFSKLKRAPTEEPIALKKEKLLNLIREQFKQYIEFTDKRYYTFFSLWTIGTYCFPLFNTYPYVHLVGLMQSGKSKLLSLCSCLSFNAIHSADMTSAVIYRIVELNRCSLFIDEAEALSKKNIEIGTRKLLLSGYKKGGQALRNERDPNGNFVPRRYEVYGPKMMANIEGLEEVLASRCITIMMQRGSNNEIINSEVNVAENVWQEIRDNIYPFIMVNWREIKQHYIDFQNDTKIASRELELWKPILTLAQFFGNEVFEEMKAFAIEKSVEKNRDSVTDEQVLLETLLVITGSSGYYSLRKIRDVMADRLDSGSWLDHRKVARLLKAFGFNKTRRMSHGTEFWLEAGKVNGIARRFGVSVDSEDSEDVPERVAEEQREDQ